MAVSISEANSLISNFLRSGQFRNIRFEKYGDRNYVSYVSDELNGPYLRAFGGDYESSISVAYSQDVGLSIEIYFSNKVARSVWHLVPMIVREGIEYYGYENFVHCSFTKYIPGEYALTVCLTTQPSSGNQMADHLAKLGEFVYGLTSQF